MQARQRQDCTALERLTVNVEVVLVVDDSATETPIIIEKAIAVMSQVLIMSCSPRDGVRAETTR